MREKNHHAPPTIRPESGHRLESVDRTYLVLVSGKLVPHKRRCSGALIQLFAKSLVSYFLKNIQ